MQNVKWSPKLRRFVVTVGQGRGPGSRATKRTVNRDAAGAALSKREQEKQLPALIADAWQEWERRQSNQGRPLTVYEFCKVYADPAVNRLSDFSWSRERRYKIATIMSDLGHHDLETLDTLTVAAWVADLEKRVSAKGKNKGKPYKPSTVAKYVQALEALYTAAELRGIIQRRRWRARKEPINPASDRTAWSAAACTQLLAVARKRIDAVTDAEETRVPGTRDRRREEWFAARFLLITGARPVEAMRLEWSDVESHQVLLKGKRRGKRREEYRARWLPLVDDDGERTQLGQLFDEMREHAADACVLFPSITARTWPAKRWRELCQAADVPSTSAYDLRHTSITRMLTEGHSIVLVAEWHGTSVPVIQARYQHLLSDHLRGLV